MPRRGQDRKLIVDRYGVDTANSGYNEALTLPTDRRCDEGLGFVVSFVVFRSQQKRRAGFRSDCPSPNCWIDVVICIM